MHIGDRIKARRVALGWSQRELAEKMGYKNHSVVARAEAGKVDLPQSRLDQFAKVLGISHGYLLGLVSEEESKRNDKIVVLIAKMKKDPEFLEVVSMLEKLEPAEYDSIKPQVVKMLQNPEFLATVAELSELDAKNFELVKGTISALHK